MAVLNSAVVALLGAVGGILPFPADNATPTETPPASPAPELAVSVTNAQDRLDVGAETEYRITLRNEGDQATESLLLAQTAPAQLEFRTADGGGVIEGDTVVWRVSLDPGEDLTRTTTAELTARPEQGEVTATVCVGREDESDPLVCRSDTDQLAEDGGLPLGALLTGAAVALAVVLLVGIAALVLLRPRRSQGRHAS